MGNRFTRLTDDLLARPEVQRLARRKAHHFTRNRLEHSLATARLAYILARLLHADARVAVRAALLHDWYFEARDEHANRVGANVHHYRIAEVNARGIGEGPAVIEAIATHMWPYGRRRPASTEAWIVWMADNITWVTDALVSIGTYARRQARTFLYGPGSEPEESYAS